EPVGRLGLVRLPPSIPPPFMQEAKPEGILGDGLVALLLWAAGYGVQRTWTRRRGAASAAPPAPRLTDEQLSVVRVPRLVSLLCGNPAGPGRLVGPGFKLQLYAALLLVLGAATSMTRMPIGFHLLAVFLILSAAILAVKAEEPSSS